MDYRKALSPQTVLPFDGMNCTLEEEIGRGANAIVYRGWYPDMCDQEQKHIVLIKELFPLHPNGAIYRDESNNLVCAPEGLGTLKIHQTSFRNGNIAHLILLEKHPEQIGANLNTFRLHNTKYTVLGFTGGRSLKQEIQSEVTDLKLLAKRMLGLLEALEAFHSNGFLHLDIAPDNIFLIGKNNQERVMLIDYNSVYILDDLQQDSAVCYSEKEGYTAPEICTGKGHTIGTAADLYSVTAVFYRCLTGSILSRPQRVRSAPPDVSNCACLLNSPETVRNMVQQILNRGFQTFIKKRYKSIDQMRESIQELLDRIEGVGITHWALWEAGKNNVNRVIRQNPSLSYLFNKEELFPVNAISEDGTVMPMRDYISEMLSPDGNHALLTVGGGMGKTTAMLCTVLEQDKKYSPIQPAITYISLYGWKEGNTSYIYNRILENLRFKSDTSSFEDARQALRSLLNKPLATKSGEKPLLLLLLDGLNEASGATQTLIEEIIELSHMPGVRIMVSTRSEEPLLPFPRVKLNPLTNEDVQQILSKHGLIPPEDPEILKTPLMLSIFLQSAQSAQKQIFFKNPKELMELYFATLREKEVNRLTEDTAAKWQIEAAISFVLPAIANELHKNQCSLSDSELLPIVERCYRLFSARLLRRAFPQWIGYSKAIKGGTANAEEWYGQIVHGLLWKRLGLLVRNELGKYQIVHQLIEEYLLDLARKNKQNIWKHQQIKMGLLIGIFLLLISGSSLVYTQFIRPQPYNEIYAEKVLADGLFSYAEAGNQYEAIYKLVDCALNKPENYAEQLKLYQNSSKVYSFDGFNLNALETLNRMLESGEVIPWSGKSWDENHYRELSGLAQERREEYAKLVAALTYIMDNERAYRLYGDIYPALLFDLIELDADIVSTLYKMVCQPHITGKFADSSVEAVNYNEIKSSLVQQNKHLNCVAELSDLYGARQRILEEINGCGALAIYTYD